MRLLLYIVFSTAGMASMAIALLAPVVTVYYTDQNIIAAQEQKISSLTKLYHQQQELLGKLHDPAVITRAAESNLNYISSDTTSQPGEKLPHIWPELRRALDNINISKPPIRQNDSDILKMAQILTNDKTTQITILLLGSLLILISLTCFCGRRLATDRQQ